MKPKKKLRLYVWENVLTDYTSGMMCALATSPDHARKLVLKKMERNRIDDLGQEPTVVSRPEGFFVFGGS